MSNNVPVFDPSFMRAPKAAFKVKPIKVTLAFRAELDTVEAVDSVCTDVQHKRGDVLDMLVREALIARGKLSSQG